MKNKNSKQVRQLPLFAVLCGLSVFVLGAAPAWAVDEVAPEISAQKADAVAPAAAKAPADYVSINVDGGSLVQVLNAFALQTGRNIVVGPNVVVSNGVNLHLNNVRWDEALDVILKPYGFGYRLVGETLVVSKLSEMAMLATVEPLETKVFNLKYLDASDVQGIIRGQLSARDTSNIMAVKGQIGWDFSTTTEKDSDAAVSMGKRRRQESNTKAQGAGTQGKSKTLIVTDVPGSLARITAMLAEVDIMQKQILVESRIMEVNSRFLKNSGLDYQKMTFAIGGGAVGQHVEGLATDPFGKDSGGSSTFDAQSYGAVGSSVAVINFLEQDDDTKVLSAPRILALNNQEATIVVGQKYPIIITEINESGGSDEPTKTTQLDYYENSGIELNVVPQICADDYINMIVHPTVSTFIDLVSVEVGARDKVSYPIIDVREAETQIMLKSGETAVIGGLLKDQAGGGVQKIPVLGSIPLIGRLFRNETADNQTIDLLIFLTATIVTPENRNEIIGDNGKSGPPVTITVPAASEVPPAAVIQEPVAIAVKSEESAAPASVDQIYTELQK